MSTLVNPFKENTELSKELNKLRTKILSVIKKKNIFKGDRKVLREAVNLLFPQISEQQFCFVVENQQQLNKLNDIAGRNIKVDFAVSEVKDETCFLSEDVKVANKLLSLRKRCIAKNIEFDLTLADIKRMLRRKRCSITNQKISSEFKDGHPQKLSFERIDNSKGYTKDNVIIVAAWINALKSALFEENASQFILNKETLTDIIKMMEFYKKHL